MMNPERHSNPCKIFFILCLNSLTSLVGADFKWYHKVYETNDNDWIELRSSNFSSYNVKSEILSTVYLSFSRRPLAFEFPFYGEKINVVSVTTQGFISMIGESYGRPFETQYVSPLMANYSPRSEAETAQDIRIHQDADMLIVQWSTMLLAEEESTEDYFTFQTQLHRDGTIKFIYKEVPMSVASIVNDTHPVVVGLSGGYRITQAENFVYKAFDTTNLSKDKIVSHSTYTLIPQPTCLEETNCGGCRARSEHCKWCPTLQRCSTGKDSLKPIWDMSCQILSQSACETAPIANETQAEKQPTEPYQPSQETEGFVSSDPASEEPPQPVKPVNTTDKEKSNTDMVVIKALLISTCAIVLLLIVATLLVRQYGWRSAGFMSPVKLENKGCDCQYEINHTLIKVEQPST